MQDDGHTWGEHLAALVERGKRSRAELDGPPIPPEGEYLWRWYCELERTRQMAAHAVQAMTYTEIAAWAALTDCWPLPHEVDALLTLDLATRAALADA